MAVLIKSDRNWATKNNRDQWLVQNQSELSDLPETTGPGSIAYTASMNHIWMKNEDGEWDEIGEEEA